MSLKEVIRKIDFKDNDLKGKVREMALMLCKEILGQKNPVT